MSIFTVHWLAERNVGPGFLSYFCRKIKEIYDQMRRLGMSVDWTRACFTLDEVSNGLLALRSLLSM